MKMSCTRHIAPRLAVMLLAMVAFASVAEAKDFRFFSPYPHIDMKNWQISNGWSNGPHQSCEWRSDAVRGRKKVVELKLSAKGGRQRPIGCGEIHTKERLGYGRYEARLRTAGQSGLNTAF